MDLAKAERAAQAIQQKLDRLDEAFLFERSIDIDTYDRHAEKLRQDLTLLRMDRHSDQVDDLDVEGILAFAERILPRASDLWIQASLEQRQRFQQLFFPEGISFDGSGFVGTAATAPAFNYLRPVDGGNERLVDQNSAGWNPLINWWGQETCCGSADSVARRRMTAGESLTLELRRLAAEAERGRGSEDASITGCHSGEAVAGMTMDTRLQADSTSVAVVQPITSSDREESAARRFGPGRP